MIDHTVGKFFETLFWIGALLIFISFFYPRWFVITITLGIVLMVMATVREGFRLRRAKTFIGVVKQNEPKIIHRIILLIGVIIVFVYLFLKQTLVYDFLTQLYDLTGSPATVTWWVFVLTGITIGILILFFIAKLREAGIEIKIQPGGIVTGFWKKVFTYMFKKRGKVEKEEKIKVKKKEAPVEKKITAELKQGFIPKMLLEEKGFWKRVITPLFKKLRKKKPEKLELKKKETAVAKKVTVELNPGFLARMFWEEKSFWRRILIPLLKKLENRRIKKLEEKKIRIEELKKKKIGELKLKAKKEKILIKVELKKHPLFPRVLIALFIFAITTILVLYKKGKFSIENPVSAVTLGLIVGLFTLYILVNIYKVRKEKKIIKEKKEEVVLAKIKKEVVAKASKYETDVDKLYKLIEEVGSLTISEVAEGFGITREQAEEWGKILESHDLIELNYPAIGELQLCKKKSKITE